MPTVSDICTDALFELGNQQAGTTPDGDDIQRAFTKLQRMVDAWQIQRQLIYNVGFETFTLIPNHQPHTIGPSGDFDVPIRPIKIINANVIINTSSPDTRYPLAILTDDEWSSIAVRNIASALPENLYYSPDFPLGNVYLWPKPNIAYGLELETWTQITQITALSDSMVLPPGYWDAIVYSLAESLIPSFPGCPSAQAVVMAAARARRIIAVTNSKPKTLISDAPQGGDSRDGWFNVYSGLIE